MATVNVLLLGASAAPTGAARGGSAKPSLITASFKLCVRALKKQSGRGCVAEKSMSPNGGTGSQVSMKNGASSSCSVKRDLSSVSALPTPKPPAGFILDDEGEVVVVAPAARRTVTIIDQETNRPLECMIRRAFRSSDGRDCLLLLPLDMPIQILKIDEENGGWTELSDGELEEVLATAAYALAKRRLHLIVSGFCLTARGGFCYTEEHILDFNTEYGDGLGDSLAEGVEIATFQLDDIEYVIYTPFDPVMFVACRDEVTGKLQIVDDDLLDDEVVLDAIDEENEFQALVDEEDAMHETLREAT